MTGADTFTGCQAGECLTCCGGRRRTHQRSHRQPLIAEPVRHETSRGAGCSDDQDHDLLFRWGAAGSAGARAAAAGPASSGHAAWLLHHRGGPDAGPPMDVVVRGPLATNDISFVRRVVVAGAGVALFLGSSGRELSRTAGSQLSSATTRRRARRSTWPFRPERTSRWQCGRSVTTCCAGCRADTCRDSAVRAGLTPVPRDGLCGYHSEVGTGNALSASWCRDDRQDDWSLSRRWREPSRARPPAPAASRRSLPGSGAPP